MNEMYTLLSEEEIMRYFEEMKMGSKSAREKLILHNMKLIYYRYYTRFNNTGIEMEDIISLGTVGLIEAVDTFDINRKTSFSTYAVRCIDNRILMYMRKNRTKYVLDVSLVDDEDDDDISLIDLLADSTNIEDEYIDKEVMCCVKLVIDNLNDDEKYLLDLYINKGLKQQEIADMFNVGQSIISRRISKIIRKVQSVLIRNGMLCSDINKKRRRVRQKN